MSPTDPRSTSRVFAFVSSHRIPRSSIFHASRFLLNFSNEVALSRYNRERLGASARRINRIPVVEKSGAARRERVVGRWREKRFRPGYDSSVRFLHSSNWRTGTGNGPACPGDRRSRGGRRQRTGKIEEGRDERVLLAKQICTHVLVHLSPSQFYLRCYSPFKDFSRCPGL